MEVRMERDHDALAGELVARRFERLSKRRRMVCVVVVNLSTSCSFSLVLEAAPRALEILECLIGDICRYIAIYCHRSGFCGARVLRIEFSEQFQGWHGYFRVINDARLDSFQYGSHVRTIRVCDNGTMRRYRASGLIERLQHARKCRKIIGVVQLRIRDDEYLRRELQHVVAILACFDNKEIGAAGKKIRAEIAYDRTDDSRRLFSRVRKNSCEHPRRRGLAHA